MQTGRHQKAKEPYSECGSALSGFFIAGIIYCFAGFISVFIGFTAFATILANAKEAAKQS